MESCLLHIIQVKQFKWNTLLRALRTRSLGEMPWAQPAHLVPKHLRGEAGPGVSSARPSRRAPPRAARGPARRGARPPRPAPLTAASARPGELHRSATAG